jgi:hypothetical protein
MIKKLIFIWDWNSIHLKKWISFFLDKFDIIIISDTKIDKNNIIFWNKKWVKLYDYNINWNKILKLLNIFRKFLMYNYLLLKYKNNIFNFHYISLNIIFSLPSLFFVNKKIATFWWSDYNLAKWLQKYIINFSTKIFDYITSDTQEILMWLNKKYKAKKEKLFYINHWIDTNIFKYKKKKNIDNEIIIFSPRALQSFYNHHLLWENIEGIKNKLWTNFKLKFIRYNENKKYYLELLKIKKEYPNNIEILNNLSQEELAEEYINSHIVISIPNNDWMPVTLLESIFTNTPLIWINLIDYNKVLWDEYLVNNITYTEVINKILLIKNNYNYYINSIEKIAKKIKKDYDYSYNMKKIEELYIK